VRDARALEAAEQRGEPRELHRLPDRQTSDHLHDPRQDHHDVEQLLHRVVDGDVLVRDVQVQGLAHRLDDLAHADRQQALAEAAGGDAIDQVSNSVQCQQPHGGEMP